MSRQAIQLPPDLSRLVRGARRVEFFTGAGMSADSGLNTFRDARTGMWSHVDPQAMADITAWRRDPSPIWPWYLWRLHLSSVASPNPGHTAIARWCRLLSEAGGWGHVTTQNIDNLHERAGTHEATHLHGELVRFRCDTCHAPAAIPEIPTQPLERLMPPRCECCGDGWIRPDVVWFGEALPDDAWRDAELHTRSADLMVVVGTSGVVYPAAALPLAALARGVPVVEVSPDPTQLSDRATFVVPTTAAKALPALLAEAEPSLRN